MIKLGSVSGFLIACAWRLARRTPQIGHIEPGTPAAESGFQIGDMVLSIDGQPVIEFDDIVKVVTVSNDRILEFRVLRAGQEVTVKVAPRAIQKPDMFGNKVMDTGVGVGPVMPGKIARVVPGSPAEKELKAGD